MRFLLLGWWFGLACAVTQTLTQPPAHAQTQAGDKTFTLRLLAEPETLDWNRAHTPIETFLLVNLMDGLVGLDQNLKPYPMLAQSWRTSADGKTYTFKLRPQVKWSDGVTLKAQDFVYSWRRLLTPATGASYASMLYSVVGAQEFNQGKDSDFSKVGLKALDDLTLQVKLLRPESQWIYIPSFWVTFPLREDVVEKNGASWETPGKMVTLGPFTLAAHDLQARIVMKANPTYYGKRGNVEQVVGLIVNDDSTALKLYEAGRLDFLGDLSTLDLNRLQKNPERQVFPYLKTAYLGFATDKPLSSNVHLRRAIAMAIDKTQLGELLHGGQVAATTFVPPAVLGYSKKNGLPFDLVRARAELKLAEASLKPPLRLELLLLNLDKSLMIGQYLQGELKKNLGIEVILQPFDNRTYRNQLNLRAFPLFFTSWSADYPDPDSVLSIFYSRAGNNRPGWKNKKYDELLLKARNLLNPKAREKIYAELQSLLLVDEAAVVPTYYEPNVVLIRSRVHGLELNPVNYLNLRKVTLAE
jgi:oligopeptide transport system substrate-binding protein